MAVGLFAATSLRGEPSVDADWHELDAFIVEESALHASGDLSPLSVNVRSFFGAGKSLEEVPRSLTLLTAELQDLIGVDNYDTLDRFGAGTQRINYFGLAGSAFVRGARAGTYFNGMLRAYQRNEMPMSFGALEGMEIVKGPVPAGFSPTLVGGGVNQIPKSPFFDQRRGSLELGIGSWNERFVQLDFGSPLMVGDRPAAYRVSYTGHRADRFYDNVPNDYDSLYAAMKIRLGERHRLFFGAELYDFRSSEIPGINRPTAQLIRDRAYVIGEPPLLTQGQAISAEGQVIRPLVEFPYTLVVNPQLFALAIPGPVARASMDPALLGQMLNLNDPAVIEQLYRVRPIAEVPPFARWAYESAQELLAGADQRTTDAYLYTPEYFAAGGTALTEKLPPQRVLADPDDRADATDVIVFADWEITLSPDTSLTNRLFLEHLDTDKLSTYGFAFQSSQWIANLRSEWTRKFADPRESLAIGLDLRFSKAETLQDFDAEPFSRRDLSRDSISANSVVAAGGQLGPDGLNYWSAFGNASESSELVQSGLYIGGAKGFGERMVMHFGGRLENGWWETALPGQVDRASEADRAARRGSGDTVLYSAHLNPHVDLGSGLYAYATVQLSKAIAPGDGGTISSKDNFTDAELYEIGLKYAAPGGRVYSSLSVYHWDQAAFSSRDAEAQPLRAKGIEWEFSAPIGEYLFLMGAFTAQRVQLRGDLLGFGALPKSEQDWALSGGILDAAGDRTAPNNPEMVYAGLPELSAHLHAVVSLPGGWQIAVGPIWRDAFYHDMQRSLRIPSHVIWNGRIRYEAEKWWASLRVDNVFDTGYWIGQEPVFSANTLILQGEARRYSARLGFDF